MVQQFGHGGDRMKKCLIFALILTVWGVAGNGAADGAQETTEGVTRLGDVVVTGTRSSQKVEKIPAHVTVITADQIRASGAQSVPDVLRSLGGVLVRDLNGNGNNQVVDIGGFGETADRHVAVVINGRRVNPIDQGGVRFSLIPVENIERIEVLHGSGSVLYGDNAMGGVINIITKDQQKGFDVNAELGAGSHDMEKAHAQLGLSKGALSAYLGATNYGTDGYRDRSESERRNVYGKVKLTPNDMLSLYLEFDVGDAEYQLPGVLSEAQRDADRRQAIPQNDEGRDEDGFVGLGVDLDWGDWGLLKLNLSRRAEEIDSDMASWFSYMMIETETTGLAAQYVLGKRLFGQENRLTMGVDFYKTDYDAWRGAFKYATTNSYRHSKRTDAYYIQDEFSILDRLVLNVGARYEDPEIQLGANVGGGATRHSYDDAETAWNVGLAYSFLPGSKVYARAYRSFRYPVVDEYTSLFTGAISTDLTQETAKGYEAGVRLALDSMLVLSLRLYTMDVQDEISWNNVTNQNENLDRTRHRGGELDIRFQPLKYLSLYGSLGYADAEFTDGANDGEKVPLVPKWKAGAGLEVNPPCGFRGRIQYNYVDERYFGTDYGNTQRPMDDYHTVDVYLSYRYKMVEFFLNGTNIFNEEYSDFGFYNSWGPNFLNYYPMPEAVYYGGIRINFDGSFLLSKD
jgi:iron complex outermembrane recepter protein